jgi:CTP synthase
MFHEGGLDEIIVEKLQLKCKKPDLKGWENFVQKCKNPQSEIVIAVCGKYVHLHDSYKSIIEAFAHAGVANNTRVTLKWVDSESLEGQDSATALSDVCGLLIPGGFGSRGIEGKINAVRYARKNRIPFFGICLGLQCAVIDFSREVCGLEAANSTEFNESPSHPVIDLMEDQKRIKAKGGTMRLGAQPCVIKKGTKAHQIYGTDRISERHRHRLEVNNNYREILEQHGMIISGVNPELDLVEIIELSDHPWFVAVQFHPELKSRALNVHPLFKEFVAAALKYKQKNK